MLRIGFPLIITTILQLFSGHLFSAVIPIVGRLLFSYKAKGVKINITVLLGCEWFPVAVLLIWPILFKNNFNWTSIGLFTLGSLISSLYMIFDEMYYVDEEGDINDDFDS